MSAVVAVVVGFVVAVLIPRTPSVAGRVPTLVPAPPPRAKGSSSAGTWLASISFGVAVAVVAGGFVGAVMGVLAIPVSIAVVRWLSSPSQRAHELALGRQSPLACDLMAAVLASGADPVSSLGAVARAVGDPLGGVLLDVQARLVLGADARSAWSAVAANDGLAVIASAMVRASESGAPLADALRRAASDLRLSRRAQLLARARVLGVRAVLPLGLCFLPAFVLLGVVPVVVSLISQVLVVGR